MPHLKLLRKMAGWFILPGVLFPFDASLFFAFWGWTFLGFWLFFESLISFMMQKMEFMGDDGNTITLQGKRANGVALLVGILAIIIFIVPGIMGLCRALRP